MGPMLTKSLSFSTRMEKFFNVIGIIAAIIVGATQVEVT